jgi:hypothetical protein
MAWDYGVYVAGLKTDAADYSEHLGRVGGVMGQNAQNVYKEILAQQQAGSEQYWSAGKLANTKAAAADFALRLAENGIGSLRELGQRKVEVKTYDGEAGETIQTQTEYFNKSTGEALPDWARVQRSGSLKLNYNLHFTEDGYAIPYTSRESSSWVQFRDSTLKPVAGIVLAAYGVPYVAGALGATAAGASIASIGGQAALTGVSAAAVSGGVSLLGGASFEDALKNSLVSGLTAGAAAGYADTIGQTLGFQAGSVASKAAGQAVVAGVKAGVTDENVLQSMATAAVASYLSNKEPKFDATANEGSLAKPSFDDSSMTTDFTTGANLNLTSNLKFPSTEGINVDNRAMGDNYDLTAGTTQFETGLQDTSANLKAMGGAQGITVGRDDGSVLSGKDFNTGLSTKDIKTAVKIGGVLMAGDEVIDQTIGSSLGSKSKQSEDIYRDAPLAGFKMVQYEDAATGATRYIPFVGNEALLPPPVGYSKTSFAKGGFVSRRA